MRTVHDFGSFRQCGLLFTLNERPVLHVPAEGADQGIGVNTTNSLAEVEEGIFRALVHRST